MPKLKRLLVSACFETAQRNRSCCRNRGHEICKGDKCLIVKENMSYRNYCMECTRLILQNARQESNCLFDKIEA